MPIAPRCFARRVHHHQVQRLPAVDSYYAFQQIGAGEPAGMVKKQPEGVEIMLRPPKKKEKEEPRVPVIDDWLPTSKVPQ